MDAAAEVRPGSWPEELTAPLARYYARSGEARWQVGNCVFRLT